MSKKLTLIVFGLMLGILSLVGKVRQVDAGVCDPGSCWGTRAADEYVCSTDPDNPDACARWSFEENGTGRCSNIPGSTCTSNADCYDPHTGGGSCSDYCLEYGTEGGDNCVTTAVTLGCSETASYCRAVGTITSCTTQTTDSKCKLTTSTKNYGCCGPGNGTHMACVSNSCTSVAGDGADSCSNDGDCEPADSETHNECINDACVNVNGAGSNECSTSTDCLSSYRVRGYVYEDNSGSCSDTSSPVAFAGDVSTTGYPIASVWENGSWRIDDLPDSSTYAFTLTGLDPSYACDCGNCQISVDVDGGNVTTANFFVTSQRDAWWQTSGGDAGSNISNVVSNIPNTCLIGSGCYPFMTRGSDDSSGIITYLTGTNSFGDGGTASEGVDYVAQANIPTNRGIEGYDYFYRQFEMGPSPYVDFSGSGVGKPSDGPDNGRAYFSDGNLTLDGSNWNLNPGETIVVFVDGNLVVDAGTRTIVDSGEFLSFVVSGDITFNTRRTDHTSEIAQVEGVFIADGSIITSVGSDKFVGEGIFIGWGGVSLGRDFGDADNTLYPSELFIYRPDFVTNAPDAMKRPVVRWEEVAP